MAKPKDLQDAASKLNDFLKIQKQSVPETWKDYSDYMAGMYNGIAFSKALVEDSTPEYIRGPVKPESKVRHKSKK